MQPISASGLRRTCERPRAVLLGLVKGWQPVAEIGPNTRPCDSPHREATVMDGVTAFSPCSKTLKPACHGGPDAECERLMNAASRRQAETEGPDVAALVQVVSLRDPSSNPEGQGICVPKRDHLGVSISDPAVLKLAEDHFRLSIVDNDVLVRVHAIASERGLRAGIIEPDVSPKAVHVAADRSGRMVSAVLPAINADVLRAVFEPVVDDGIVLVCDGNRACSPRAAATDVRHDALNLSGGERVRNAFHVPAADSRHGRLKGFQRRCHAVAPVSSTTASMVPAGRAAQRRLSQLTRQRNRQVMRTTVSSAFRKEQRDDFSRVHAVPALPVATGSTCSRLSRGSAF